jgi:hypothetical protein
LSLKNCFVLIAFAAGTFLEPAVWAAELNVFFKTTPRQELLRPFADPIDLSLLITGADGRPIQEGTVAIRLDAPSPGRFFSTDFPLVEGTLLNEMQLPVLNGRANWKQLFPIRGQYRLTVDAVANDGSKTTKTFNFEVRENRTKWLVLAAFSAGLFLLGLVAGRVFTGTRASGVGLVLAAAILLGWVTFADAQAKETARSAVLEIEPATVGRPSMVRWKLTGSESADARAAILTLNITHLEKQKTVFAVEKIAVPGEWSMKFHFPDGAAYRVAAVGNLQGSPPVRNEQVVTVTGVEPPASAMIPALSFFAAVIAAGLGVGRWSKRRMVG